MLVLRVFGGHLFDILVDIRHLEELLATCVALFVFGVWIQNNKGIESTHYRVHVQVNVYLDILHSRIEDGLERFHGLVPFLDATPLLGLVDTTSDLG